MIVHPVLLGDKFFGGLGIMTHWNNKAVSQPWIKYQKQILMDNKQKGCWGIIRELMGAWESNNI